MIFLLAVLACGSQPAPAPTPAATLPATSPASTPVSAEAGHEHGGGHGHDATHGGIQKELDGLHVEAVITPAGVMFYPKDAENKPISVAEVTGSAVVKGPAGVATVTLNPMGDHLHGEVKLELGKPATVALTLTYQQKPQSVTFDVPAVGLSSHDHTSLHGGVVGMWNDYHVEFLTRDGEFRFWISDDKRVVVGQKVSGVAKVGDVSVPLVFEPSTGMLSGKAVPAAGKMVMLEATVNEKAFTLGFNGE